MFQNHVKYPNIFLYYIILFELVEANQEYHMYESIYYI